MPTLIDQTRLVGHPEPGWYRVRLVRGGPWVPARIVLEPTPDPWFPENPMDRPCYWSTVVNGEPSKLTEIVPGKDVWRIHEWGERIDKETYDLMVEQAAWDKRYDPASPLANPDKRVDLSTAPTFF
jgi:hypothetical protein